MKVSDLRKNSTDELKIKLNDLFKEQFNLKMQRGTGQLTRYDKVKKVRRAIARVQTIINEMASA